jgi:hypothetical protein
MYLAENVADADITDVANNVFVEKADTVLHHQP